MKNKSNLREVEAENLHLSNLKYSGNVNSSTRNPGFLD